MKKKIEMSLNTMYFKERSNGLASLGKYLILNISIFTFFLISFAFLLEPLEDGGALLSLSIFPYWEGLLLLSCLLLFAQVFDALKWLGKWGYYGAVVATSLSAALLILTAWENYQVLEEGHVGLHNLFQVSILILFIAGFIGLWFDRKTKHQGFGAFLSPLLLAGVLFVMYLESLGQAGPQELVPALKSYWLPWHVLANFIGYGCFMVAAVAGAMFLVRERSDKKGKTSILPDLKSIQTLMNQAISLGFPVFTIAVFLGCVWAAEAWGAYWSWDPKETWALIVWLVYAGYLHAHHLPSMRGKNILAIWSILGFFITLFCYIGVNMFLSGLHSYGQL